jgi:hypothetical protein
VQEYDSTALRRKRKANIYLHICSQLSGFPYLYLIFHSQFFIRCLKVYSSSRRDRGATDVLDMENCGATQEMAGGSHPAWFRFVLDSAEIHD